MKRKTTEQFKKDLYTINPNIEVIGEYVNRDTPIQCHCLICGYGANGEWSNRPSNMLCKKQGCPRCRDAKFRAKYAKTHEDFIEEMRIKNPDVEVIGTYFNNETKIKCKCKKCGHEWDAKPKHLTGKCTGCPRCVDNHKREKATLEILNKYYNNVEPEYKFEDLKGINGGFLRFDAKLEINNKIYLIEVQGEQHEHSIEYMGGEEEFEIRKEHDRRKKEYANLHGYTLIEIWYYEDIFDKLQNCGLCKEVIPHS